MSRSSSRSVSVMSLAEATMAVTSIQSRYERVIMQGSRELMDFTDYDALRKSLKLTLLATIDSLVWGTYNFWILCLFCFCAVIWPAVELAVKFIKIVTYTRGHAYSSPNENPIPRRRRKQALSAVNSIDPNFHAGYRPNWAKIHPLLTQTGSRLKSAPFNFDLAEFLLHLSALAYESDDLVGDMITYWNDPVLDLRYARFGHQGLIMVVLYSIPGRFVVVAFKGTSPFDLTEWLTDCSLRKTAAKNGLLPGLVHSGFYDVFGFPDKEKVIFDNPASPRQPTLSLPAMDPPALEGFDDPDQPPMRPVLNSALAQKIQLTVNAFRRRPSTGMTFKRTRFWEHIEDEFRSIVGKFAAANAGKPSLIMTGHSLGGATASMFSSLLLWRRTGSPSSVMRLDWDACFRLEGCMTFGTPRPGDSTWSNAIEAVRISTQWTPTDQPLFYSYRVINSDDFIATCPISPVIDFRWQVGWDQPHASTFLSLLDSRHYGTPILLHHRSREQRFDGVYSQRERFLSDFVANFLGAVIALPEMLRSGNWKSIAIAILKLFGLPSLVIDHWPSEYAANMGRVVTPLNQTNEVI